MSDAEIKKSICTWCKGECGLLVHVLDGKLVKIEEDPDYPKKVWPAARGCVRLRAAAEFFYHPDRVNFPRKRTGDKGEGKWQTISWEQAFDEIAEKLIEIKEKYGGEAIASSGGTNYRTDMSARVRFHSLVGVVNNIGAGGMVCWATRNMVANSIVGYYPHYSIRPTTKCIVSLGSELTVSRPANTWNFREARKNGAKHIVIDPRKSWSAAQADVWLQLRPATDCALLLGMINVMINEELYDKKFVEGWCYGFDKVKELIEEYPLEKVAQITGVPPEKIREATRVYATNRPGAMIEGMGIEQLQQNAETIHARWILAALAGNIDLEGGEELVGPYLNILDPIQAVPYPPLSEEQASKRIPRDRFKLLTGDGSRIIAPLRRQKWGRTGDLGGGLAHNGMVIRAIITGKPYPVRAMITAGGNPMITAPNTKEIYRALKSLDLYVVIDHWMTPSAELADYVLPVATWLQKPILWDFHNCDNYYIAGEQALPVSIPGEYDHRNDYDIYRELGIRMGQEKYWPDKSLEDLYDARLKPTGMTHKEFVHKVRCMRKPQEYKKYEKEGFLTPTGKVELYSTIFEKLGYDPLPRFRESSETYVSNPELAKEYPLTLLTGARSREYYHSEGRMIESIRKTHPYPLLQIHPQTAVELGIEEGDWVWIETLRGRVKHKATLFEGIRPECVMAEHGWWLPELPGEEPWLRGVWEVNINVVTDNDPEVCNPISGGWPLRTGLCKVYKVKSYE
ncbi:molybdopterin-dependent oxidoreductase [Chloroflexota bacterium]